MKVPRRNHNKLKEIKQDKHDRERRSINHKMKGATNLCRLESLEEAPVRVILGNSDRVDKADGDGRRRRESTDLGYTRVRYMLEGNVAVYMSVLHCHR